MATLNEHVLNEAGERQDRLTVGELVTLIERHDPDGGPGVTRERVREYAEALAERDAPVNPDKVDGAVDDRLAEDGSLSAPLSSRGSTSLFPVGEGRVSAFPVEWHEAFPDRNASVRDVVEFALRDTEGSEEGAEAGAGARDRTERAADTDVDADDGVAARGDPDDDSAAMARDHGTADAGSDAETAAEIAEAKAEAEGANRETGAGDDGRKTGAAGESAGAGSGPGDRPADSGGAGSGEVADGPRGVPRQVVLNAATVFGGREWSTAQGELESLRGEGVVVEDLDQHPNPNVRLATDEEETAADRAQE